MKSVDSFDNNLQDPVHFQGALSIPKKYSYEVESDTPISITTYYDVMEDFVFSPSSVKFSMPFVWSDANISQISVVHQGVKIIFPD